MTESKTAKDATVGQIATDVGGRRLFSNVERVLDTVNPGDVDAYVRVTDTNERVKRLRILISTWSQQQAEERQLRIRYAGILVGMFGVEVAAVLVAFFLGATGVLQISEWLGQGFLIATLAQSSGLVLVVVKYLFPDKTSEILRLVELSSSGLSKRREKRGT